MNVLIFMIPAALLIGACWLGGFMWALKSGQFDDPEGSANRILEDDNDRVE